MLMIVLAIKLRGEKKMLCELLHIHKVDSIIIMCIKYLVTLPMTL